MRRDDDMMDRLAAADPVRDRAPADPDEALLARLLATPAPAPRSRLRRRAPAVAIAACAAVAAFAAVDLLGSDTSVIDRAVAAVSKAGVVFHVVEHTTYSDPPAGAPAAVVVESWHTSDGRLHLKGYTVRDGRRDKLMEDFAGRRIPGRGSGDALRWDGRTNTITESGFGGGGDDGGAALDSFQSPGAQLRDLQEQGRLRMAGTAEVDGAPAYRLASDRLDPGYAIEYTVDAETYLPLARRITIELDDGKTLEAVTRYQVYEQLPLNPETERLLALDPHPGAKCSEFAHELAGDPDLGFPNPCAAP